MGGSDRKGGKDAAPRPMKAGIVQGMADDSTSGIVPIFGAILLLVIIYAVLSLIF